jgi:hypothetical protein
MTHGVEYLVISGASTRLIQSGTNILILVPYSICRKRIKNVREDFLTIQGEMLGPLKASAAFFSTVYDCMLGVCHRPAV